MTASLSRSARRHPLAAYFILAYAISWSLWLSLVLAARGTIAAHLRSWWHYFGAAGPILASILVTLLTEGASGLRAILARMVRWRVGVVWLLIAVLSPFALFALSAAILRVTGAPWPDFGQLGRSSSFPAWGCSPPSSSTRSRSDSARKRAGGASPCPGSRRIMAR